jgi:hypothetical protein
MTSGPVTLRCLTGHTALWDPDAEDFPSDGCDEIISHEDHDGRPKPVFCGLRYGNIEYRADREVREKKEAAEAFKKLVGGHISKSEEPKMEAHHIDCEIFVNGACTCDERAYISKVVSPDAPTTTNERGGQQSHVPVRFDLIDGKAMFAMAAVLHEGAEKYAPGNWRLIPERDHLNHALMHIYAYLSGDRTDDHLSHALCRVTFATAVNLDPDAGPERDE